jgi:hypothetical protein
MMVRSAGGGSWNLPAANGERAGGTVSHGVDIPGRGSKSGGYKALIWKAFLKII